MTKGLTEKQRLVLEAVRDYWRDNNVSPSLLDISLALEISVTTVHQHLQALKRKGHLQHIERSGRTWRPTELFDEQDLEEAGVRRVMMLGSVAASPPIPAVEDQKGSILWDRARPGEEYFGLEVVGESMRDACIHDGDILIVRMQPTAQDGEIVVAEVDGTDVTVKQLKIRDGVIILMPRNDEFDPIVIGEEHTLRILGKVIESIHRFER